MNFQHDSGVSTLSPSTHIDIVHIVQSCPVHVPAQTLLVSADTQLMHQPRCMHHDLKEDQSALAMLLRFVSLSNLARADNVVHLPDTLTDIHLAPLRKRRSASGLAPTRLCPCKC